VPLSEHEQRLFDQIERSLAEDPKFASAVRANDPRFHARRRLLVAAFVIILGLALVVYGTVSSNTLLGVAGFVVMLGAAAFALQSRRKGHAPDLHAVGGTARPLPVPTDGPPIEKHEEGWKETFALWPGEWIRVAGQFEDATGEFMYHCHILDHEDEGMMRPFVVHPPEVARFHMHSGSSSHRSSGSGHGGHS